MPAFLLDQDNNATDRTQLTRNSPGEKQPSTLVLFGTNPGSYGLRSYGTDDGAGVFGINVDANSEGMGVFGLQGAGGIGVAGQSFGDTRRGPKAKPHGIGVYGRGPDFGVHGDGDYAGVSGISPRNGVEGHSDKEAGVYGYSYEGVGVEGSSTKGSAGLFTGNVTITGDLDVQGTKSAVVRFPDGSFRRLYCQESPESWFEDFGEAKLVSGRAVVALDKRFAGVTAGTYHVFLTPQADCNGLFVRTRRRARFEVRELGGGRHTLRFSFRVVARRKDVSSPRFERVRPAARRVPSVFPKKLKRRRPR